MINKIDYIEENQRIQLQEINNIDIENKKIKSPKKDIYYKLESYKITTFPVVIDILKYAIWDFIAPISSGVTDISLAAYYPETVAFPRNNVYLFLDNGDDSITGVESSAKYIIP